MQRLTVNIEPYTFSQSEKEILASPFARRRLKDQLARVHSKGIAWMLIGTWRLRVDRTLGSGRCLEGGQ